MCNRNWKIWKDCGIWVLVSLNHQGRECRPLGSMLCQNLSYLNYFTIPVVLALCTLWVAESRARFVCGFVGIQGLNLVNLFISCFLAQFISSLFCFLRVLQARIVFCCINISSLLWWALLWGRGSSLAQITANFIFLQQASKGLYCLLSVT